MGCIYLASILNATIGKISCLYAVQKIVMLHDAYKFIHFFVKNRIKT